MRLVVYNIRYGTGTGWRFHWPLPFSGYLKRTRKKLREITDFLKEAEPDIVGLIEVDSGSYRSRNANQAELIAREMDFEHVYQSKYKIKSLIRKLPLLKSQGNAFLTGQDYTKQKFYYFENGMKRLVIKLEFEKFVVFLVHLSLKFRHRQDQLKHLYELFQNEHKPIIVAGDFNTFWGEDELALFQAASGLLNANSDNEPTYPSRSPRWQLDFVLHSPEIKIKRFEIPKVRLSDHMPVVCDFEVCNN